MSREPIDPVTESRLRELLVEVWEEDPGVHFNVAAARACAKYLTEVGVARTLLLFSMRTRVDQLRAERLAFHRAQLGGDA